MFLIIMRKSALLILLLLWVVVEVEAEKTRLSPRRPNCLQRRGNRHSFIPLCSRIYGCFHGRHSSSASSDPAKQDIENEELVKGTSSAGLTSGGNETKNVDTASDSLKKASSVVLSDFGLLNRTNYKVTTPLNLAEPTSQTITILHTNDIHSHFDQFNQYGTECKIDDIERNVCYGGVARIAHLVQKIRQEMENVLLVDAGDQYQGTLFFTVYGGHLISRWMNWIKYDVMSLGNHEFDNGKEDLARFIQNLSFPMISSNMELDDAPALKEAGLKPYTIFPQYRLAVIGFITNTTSEVSIAAKDIRFYHPVGIVQRYIQQIHEMGIKRIICVSHNGYIDDKYLAENTRGISLIVGGHSHTYLADSNSSTAAGATIDGTYPSAVTNLDGHTTYVVQAHRFGDYLGRVEIEFNDEDELVSLAGQPILLDQSVAMDPLVAKEVTDLKIMFQDKTREVVAHLTNTLDFLPCRQEECMLANLVFGSMLDYAKSIDSNHSIAFSNTGGLRAGLQRGNVTVADIIDLLPFGHTLISFEMLGSEIMNLLERTVTGRWKDGRKVASIPQFAGLRYTWNPVLPRVSYKIRSVTIADPEGKFVPLNLTTIYKVVTNDFVSNGGDNVMQAPLRAAKNTGVKMEEVLIEYMRKKKSFSGVLDGRMKKVFFRRQ